jgi:arabinose-5-phosphate isomerase
MDPILEKLTRAIDIEITSIQKFRETLDPRFPQAVQLIFESQGKLILTGVGKSGDIARKISSTLTSTGTRSVFLHPGDAAHGDAGGIESKDVVLAIGKSGESDELLFLIPTIKKIGAKLIALTANPNSRLALASDIVLVTPIWKEACPLDLAPTSSTTIALIAGDAIAMALMEMKNFKEDDFALYHPAGRLGKRLTLNIEDVMRTGEALPIVTPEDTLPKILAEITSKNIGVTCVCKEERLLGIITDFDLRKKLAEEVLHKDIKAKDIMNANPIRFTGGRKAYDVLKDMEDRERPISVVPIVDGQTLLGIVSLHDLLQRGLK